MDPLAVCSVGIVGAILGTEDIATTVAGIAVLGTDADPDAAGVFTATLVVCVVADGKKVGFWPL